MKIELRQRVLRAAARLMTCILTISVLSCLTVQKAAEAAHHRHPREAQQNVGLKNVVYTPIAISPKPMTLVKGKGWSHSNAAAPIDFYSTQPMPIYIQLHKAYEGPEKGDPDQPFYVRLHCIVKDTNGKTYTDDKDIQNYVTFTDVAGNTVDRNLAFAVKDQQKTIYVTALKPGLTITLEALSFTGNKHGRDDLTGTSK
jgi:hypothetical protein